MRLPPGLPPIGRTIDRGPAAEPGKPPGHTKARAPPSSDPHAAGARRQTPSWRGLLGWLTSAQKHPQTLLILLQMTWQPRTFPSNLLFFCPSLKVKLVCHSLMAALPACLVCSLFFFPPQAFFLKTLAQLIPSWFLLLGGPDQPSAAMTLKSSHLSFL